MLLMPSPSTVSGGVSVHDCPQKSLDRNDKGSDGERASDIFNADNISHKRSEKCDDGNEHTPRNCRNVEPFADRPTISMYQRRGLNTDRTVQLLCYKVQPVVILQSAGIVQVASVKVVYEDIARQQWLSVLVVSSVDVCFRGIRFPWAEDVDFFLRSTPN